MAYTSFPNSAVVDIFDDIPGEGEFQGTGVVIGPHSILTAAHLVYDADDGASADAISLYPGYNADSTDYNPAGALGGVQSIHFIKIPDNGDELSAAATQSDFAVIDTSADLRAYGQFSLDPDFTSGDAIVLGYPASANGYLTGAEGTVRRDGRLSDLDTAALPLSPGYSGGPLYHQVERNGGVLDAVVGTVSTGEDAMKLTPAKVRLIRHWIASDASLYAGGQDAPTGLVPQLAGTVSGNVDAAAASPFTYRELAAHPGGPGHGPAVPREFADLVNALQAPQGGEGGTAMAHAAEVGTGLAAPAHGGHDLSRITAGA